MNKKEKLTKALETLYEILKEEEQDGVNGLQMIQIYLDEAKFKGTNLFPVTEPGELVKQIAWRLNLARAITNTLPVKTGDKITEADRVVYVGKTPLVVEIEV